MQNGNEKNVVFRIRKPELFKPQLYCLLSEQFRASQYILASGASTVEKIKHAITRIIIMTKIK